MEILYTDNRIAVAIKPCGVLSTDETGGMPQLLRKELCTECIRTVHRLDASVSGVMVFARSKMAASLLSAQIRNGTFQKEYLAVVHGRFAQPDGILRDLLVHDTVRRKTFVASQPQKDAKQAELSYRVLGQLGDLSLLSLRLHTGRTHQIRVQLASRDHAILGDKKYGLAEEHNVALFSHRLRFLHPQTNEWMDFSAPAPDEYPWTLFKKEGFL